MVKGIDVFRDYFREYTDQYVLIGGAACSLSFEEQDINFGRTTKDLDIVLIVEAQTGEFGERFWQFIKDGRYQNRAKIFLDEFEVTEPELKNLRIHGVKPSDIKETLKSIYGCTGQEQ